MTFEEWAEKQGINKRVYGSQISPSGAYGWARAAWDAALAAPPDAATVPLTYSGGLRAALEAVRSEHLSDPTEEHGDVVYDRAVTDCENAIGSLLAAAPAAADSQDGRADFEAAWSESYGGGGEFLLRHHTLTDQYANHDTQRGWEGWKLARAAPAATAPMLSVSAKGETE